MKKIISILLSILMVLSLAACAGNSNNPSESSTQGSKPTASTSENTTEPSNTSVNEPTGSQPDDTQPDNTQPNDTETGKKVLVVYFSATGTTKKLAEYAADAMDAELYEIVPQQPYTSADLDYGDKNSRSTKEMNDPNSRPEIDGSVENMADYDIVFIGYPIWWASIPMPIASFLEEYDFSGKTIIPFCSHGGGRFGQSLTAIAKLAPDAAMGEGLSIHYSGGSTLGADVEAWLKLNNIK